MHSILLVEDDQEITRLLYLHLGQGLYQLTCCSSGIEAIEKMRNGNYNLVLLDITLPDINGIEILREVRQEGVSTPILMLTCHNDEADKVIALELGADDYVTKPFGVRELMARVKALLRRSEQNDSMKQLEKKCIAFREIAIDSDKLKASFKGQRLDLTAKEFQLLFLLASNPGKTFTRHDLLDRIWGYSFEGYEHTITSHINRLRIKIESDLNRPQYILTSWGKGYRFSD
ncbi:MAG: response regulator transcription factor [Chitinophagaceae bacterium]|nr:response regulator transcription factor [Chitinophagaceae bacterium]